MNTKDSPCRAGGTLQTCQPRKTTDNADPKVTVIGPGATKSHAPGPLVAPEPASHTPEPDPLAAPEPLPESVKAEHRQRLAKATAEQPRAHTVIPSVKINVPTSGPLVLPDENDIRTMRPIPQNEIAEVVKWHSELQDFGRTALTKAFNIGSKLAAWRIVIPHGQWLSWIAANVPEIPERTVQRYIQLWENKERIEAQSKSDTATDLTELPSIRQALADIQTKNRENKPPARANEKHVSGPKTTKPERLIKLPTPDSEAGADEKRIRQRFAIFWSQLINDPRFNPQLEYCAEVMIKYLTEFLKPEQPVSCCPTCGRALP
jgi:hypothetical protein